jgi:hypothetical protein
MLRLAKGKSLQMVLMGRFCKFKIQNRELPYANLRRGKPLSGVLYLVDEQIIAANGPAIWGGCVTRRKHRAGSWYFSQKAVTVQGGYGTCFCRHGTNFIAYWRDRGTILFGAANLSPVTKLVAGTGAVSRYKLSRRQ